MQVVLLALFFSPARALSLSLSLARALSLSLSLPLSLCFSLSRSLPRSLFLSLGRDLRRCAWSYRPPSTRRSRGGSRSEQGTPSILKEESKSRIRPRLSNMGHMGRDLRRCARSCRPPSIGEIPRANRDTSNVLRTNLSPESGLYCISCAYGSRPATERVVL